MPLPGQPQPSPTIPASPPAADAPAPERIRRRPSLAPENPAAPTSTHAPTIPPTPNAVETHPAESPVVPLPFASSAPTQPPMSPSSGEGAGSGTVPPAAPAGGGFKLKIGVKTPPPSPPPAGGLALGVPPALTPLPADTAGAPPLMPLPGLPPVGAGAAFPPPPVGPGAAASLPPLTPLPPIPEAPAMTAGVPGAMIGSGTRPPIHLRTDAPPEALDPSKLPPPLPAARARAAVAGVSSARRDAMLFALVFLVIAGVGGGAWFYFSRPDEAAETADGLREKLGEAAKLPGKAVEGAKGAVADAREKEQARIDAVAEGKEAPTERAIGAVSPAELEAKLKEANSSLATEPPSTPVQTETQSVTAYAGEKPQAPAEPPPPPQANARFVRYAEALRVSGVFQGSPARALVDGRLVRSGDVVEPNLGVSFVGVDAETKHLILQDGSGAQVRVKY